MFVLKWKQLIRTPPQFFSTFGFLEQQKIGWSRRCEPDSPPVQTLVGKVHLSEMTAASVQRWGSAGGDKVILLMVQKSGDHQLIWQISNIPLFTGFYTSQVVVWDVFHNSVYWGLNSYWFLTKNWIVEFQSSPMTSPNALAFLCLKQEFLGGILT